MCLAARPAQACGGTFCDNGPPMPVDQTGEDILFIEDGDQIEVHVRIQYTGVAERFAWMVPLAGIPDVSVGSEELFVQISRATIPVWSTQRTFEDPDDAPPPATSLGFTPDSDLGGGTGPEVVHEDVVGSFEIVVLQGGTAAEVLDFFTQNNYAFEPEAEPLIQTYLDEGFLITGVKLTASAETEAIHPLVFRFVNDEPCVPIRLTAVAARDDMGIRAYFLGQDRWAPSNYAHVVINPMAYDWQTFDWDRYVLLVSEAVDEAGGHGFVTEYAGPSDAVATGRIWREDWTAEGIENFTAVETMAALDSMGMLPWPAGPSAQLRILLREYIPPPDNWDSSEDFFWLDWFSHPELLDTPAWDGPAFAMGLDELVIVPGMHAVDMLEAWPKLTRLHTTMSAHEMTVDPTFHAAPDLPDVIDTRQTSAFVHAGFAWTDYTVPFDITSDGGGQATATLCVDNDGAWPWDSLEGMPRALRIEQTPEMGPQQVMTDNEDAILAALDAHNQSCGDNGGGGGESGDGGESGGTGAGADAGDGSVSGCACASDPAADGPGGLGGLGFGLLGLAGLGLIRRR